jgi:hypothetical protein
MAKLTLDISQSCPYALTPHGRRPRISPMLNKS